MTSERDGEIDGILRDFGDAALCVYVWNGAAPPADGAAVDWSRAQFYRMCRGMDAAEFRLVRSSLESVFQPDAFHPDAFPAVKTQAEPAPSPHPPVEKNIVYSSTTATEVRNSLHTTTTTTATSTATTTIFVPTALFGPRSNGLFGSGVCEEAFTQTLEVTQTVTENNTVSSLSREYRTFDAIPALDAVPMPSIGWLKKLVPSKGDGVSRIRLIERMNSRLRLRGSLDVARAYLFARDTHPAIGPPWREGESMDTDCFQNANPGGEDDEVVKATLGKLVATGWDSIVSMVHFTGRGDVASRIPLIESILEAGALSLGVPLRWWRAGVESKTPAEAAPVPVKAMSDAVWTHPAATSSTAVSATTNTLVGSDRAVWAQPEKMQQRIPQPEQFPLLSDDALELLMWDDSSYNLLSMLIGNDKDTEPTGAL